MWLWRIIRSLVGLARGQPPNVDSAADDPLRILAAHAARLDVQCNPAPGSAPFDELMSGALLWPDECPVDAPVELAWALRPVFAFRTSLMLGRPRLEFAALWGHAIRLFPNWVGFRPERRAPEPGLLRVYRRGERRMAACLRLTEQDILKLATDQAANDRPR